jgi:protein-tyrosine phosphatase
MKAQIHWVPGQFPGRIATMARPRGGDWLDDEIRSVREAGSDIIVSLLEPEEVTELALDAEEQECLRNGLEFISMPIPDRGVPESRPQIGRLVNRLARSLQDGRSLIIHCRQGIGRSSLVAALVLQSLGIPAEHAFTMIAEARGCAVPDTQEQIQYALRFHSE